MQCKNCNQPFTITDAEKEFCHRINVPEPELCFRCTKIKQLNWRNERFFYLRKCDLCGRDMVSCFSAEAKHPVYCNDCWWSDKFDPCAFGQEFDFGRSFFAQFEELLNKTPVGNLFIANSQNSEYTNLAVGNKDSYMTVASDYNDVSAYCSYSSYNRDVVDCTEVKNSELCYEGVDYDRCYQCFWSQNLKGCSGCHFCLNCSGCTDCFGCVNLRNQSHHWFNKQLTKEEYQEKLAVSQYQRYSNFLKLKQQFVDFKKEHIFVFSRQINCQNSSGDYLTNCQNCLNSFNMLDCVNCSNCIHGDKSKDCFEAMGLVNSELVYNSNSCPDNNNTKFSAIIWPGSSNVYYSYLCRTANDCFGCVSLHNHRYCILNKKYSEEEYKKILPQVIEHLKQTGEWGQYFPMNISPWAYNESVAQDLFPLTKEEVLKLGGRWQDNTSFTKGKETIKSADLPDDIADADSEKIVGQILACVDCGRNYKLITQELKFYKNLNIPLPRQCSDCRHYQRMKLRNPKNLWLHQCLCEQSDHGHTGRPASNASRSDAGRCSQKFETTYAPDRKEKVYCQECYQKEIY
jgi:hypothetical protein